MPVERTTTAGRPDAAGVAPTSVAATRRRGQKLEAALLEAAWDELTAAGYAAFTIEGVATRAKTSRAVIYRRWPSRPELVVAAHWHHSASAQEEVPDTGLCVEMSLPAFGGCPPTSARSSAS